MINVAIMNKSLTPTRATKSETTAELPGGRLLVAQEVAAFLRIRLSTVYAWVHAGKIPSGRLNGVIRFRENEILAWVAAQFTAPTPVGAPPPRSRPTSRPRAPGRPAVLQAAQRVIRRMTPTPSSLPPPPPSVQPHPQGAPHERVPSTR